VQELQAIKAIALSTPSDVANVHGLKEEMKALNNAISKNEVHLVALKKSKDNYQKKKEENCRHPMDEYAILQ